MNIVVLIVSYSVLFDIIDYGSVTVRALKVIGNNIYLIVNNFISLTGSKTCIESAQYDAIRLCILRCMCMHKAYVRKKDKQYYVL